MKAPMHRTGAHVLLSGMHNGNQKEFQTTNGILHLSPMVVQRFPAIRAAMGGKINESHAKKQKQHHSGRIRVQHNRSAQPLPVRHNGAHVHGSTEDHRDHIACGRRPSRRGGRESQPFQAGMLQAPGAAEGKARCDRAAPGNRQGQGKEKPA